MVVRYTAYCCAVGDSNRKGLEAKDDAQAQVIGCIAWKARQSTRGYSGSNYLSSQYSGRNRQLLANSWPTGASTLFA